jgi:ribosomal protein L20A (L18A)
MASGVPFSWNRVKKKSISIETIKQVTAEDFKSYLGTFVKYMQRKCRLFKISGKAYRIRL